MGRILIHIPKGYYKDELNGDVLRELMGIIDASIETRDNSTEAGSEQLDCPTMADLKPLVDKGYDGRILELATLLVVMGRNNHALFFDNNETARPKTVARFNAIFLLNDQDNWLLRQYNNQVFFNTIVPEDEWALPKEIPGRGNVPQVVDLDFFNHEISMMDNMRVHELGGDHESFFNEWLKDMVEKFRAIQIQTSNSLDDDLSEYDKLNSLIPDTLQNFAQAVVIERLRKPTAADQLELPDGRTIPDALKKEIKQKAERQKHWAAPRS